MLNFGYPAFCADMRPIQKIQVETLCRMDWAPESKDEHDDGIILLHRRGMRVKVDVHGSYWLLGRK